MWRTPTSRFYMKEISGRHRHPQKNQNNDQEEEFINTNFNGHKSLDNILDNKKYFGKIEYL